MFFMYNNMTIDRQRGREIKKVVVLPPENGVKMGVWHKEETVEKKLRGLHWCLEKKNVGVFKY